MRTVPVTVKLVNHGPARAFIVIVYARDVHQVIEPELLFGKDADLSDALGVIEYQGDFSAKLDRD